MKQSYLTYALKDGNIVSISDVESGMKCGCVCPACGEQLIARKGKKNIHHFAHKSGENCAYGYETSLHLAAKDILSKAKRFTIPMVWVSLPAPGSGKMACEAKEIAVDRVELEQRFDDIIPDVVAYSGHQKLFIEIYVTHAIDEEKLEKIKKANISTIEIDLSKRRGTITPDELKEILLGSSYEKRWVYNSYTNELREQFLKATEYKKRINRGFLYSYVENCPVKLRKGPEKTRADYFRECCGCKYFISQDQNGIFCSGAKLVGSVEDLSMTLEERRKARAKSNKPWY